MDSKTKPQVDSQSKKVTLTFEATDIKYNHFSQIYTITFNDQSQASHKIQMHAKHVITDYVAKNTSSAAHASNNQQTKPNHINHHEDEEKYHPNTNNNNSAITQGNTPAEKKIEHKQQSNNPQEHQTLTYRQNILFIVLEKECKSCAIDYNKQIFPAKQQILSELKLNEKKLKKNIFNRCMKKYSKMKSGPSTKLYKLYQHKVLSLQLKKYNIVFQIQIKEWEEANPENVQKPVVFWLWCNEHGISSFDTDTQNQIEDELQKIVSKKHSNTKFYLNRGLWFSKSMNYQKYEINIALDYITNKPCIKQSIQRNTSSSFQRNILRMPPLLPSKKLTIFNKYKTLWMWSDDSEWRVFDWECIEQLEIAYANKEAVAKLTTGWFTHKTGYYVKIHYECRPIAGQQMNPNNNYERPVRRITYSLLVEICDGMKNYKKKSSGNWKSKFRPLSINEFEVQKKQNNTQKNKFNCSICLDVFVEDCLLENQKKHLMSDVVVVVDDSDEWKEFIKLKFIEFFSEQLFEEKIGNVFETDIMSKLTVDLFFGGNIKKVHFNKIFRKYKIKAGPCGQLHSVLKKEGEHFWLSKKAVLDKHDNSLSGMVDEIEDNTIVSLSKCIPGHYFHSSCISDALSTVSRCPNCQSIYETIIGPQPVGYFVAYAVNRTCKGFEQYGSIIMNMAFPDGVQSSEHGNPGIRFHADTRCAFLPNNMDGREAFALIRLAFERKLLFTVGRSLTSGKENQIIFQSIHLKTRMDGGSEKHGFPDEEYFQRLKDELFQKYVTVDQLNDDDRIFIKNGFA